MISVSIREILNKKGITTEKLNQYSYEICRHHHERYDGSGYPDGFKW